MRPENGHPSTIPVRGGFGYTIVMADAPAPRHRWFRLTPDRAVLGMLALEAFLLLSEWFGWFAFNHHKGWTMLITVAAVAMMMVLVFLWFLAALAFRMRFQFSIRSLLLLMLVVAVACSWLAVARERARKQRETVAEIGNAGGDVFYDYQLDASGDEILGAIPPGPPWLRELMGGDIFDSVALVDLADLEVGDARLQHLKENLDGLPRLQELDLGHTKVSDAGLKLLEGLARLQQLDLEGTKVGDAGLAHLKGLTQLQRLNLCNTAVSDAGLAYLSGLKKLRRLDLCGTKISDAGLVHIRALTELQSLGLSDSTVSDVGLERLKGLTQLQELGLGFTDVSDAGMSRFRRAAPRCTICPFLPVSTHHGGACAIGGGMF